MNSEHVTLRIPAATIAKVIFVGILFALAYYLRDILLVVLGSVVIASSIEPIIKWFIARKIPRLIAVLIIYFGIGVGLVGAFYFLFVPLLVELQQFLVDLPAYVGSISAEGIKTAGIASSDAVQGIVNAIPINSIVSKIGILVSSLSQGFLSTASAFLGGALSFVLIVVLSFYLSVQQDGILNFVKTISPSKHRRYIVGLWNRSEEKIGLWLQGQILLCVIIAVLAYLGLSLLGIKHALLLAFLAGIFEIIPLFGPIISAVPGIAVAFVNGGVGIAVIVAAMYLIIQQFENQLIYPLVVKKVVGVPPIISIVALVIGAKLAGFLGLLFSVPVAAILMEFFNDLERDRLNEEKAEQ